MMAMQLVSCGTGLEQEVPSDGRRLEAAVLNKAASMLEEVVSHWQEDRNHAHLDNALKYNQTLWSVFQAELMNDENPLPADLRNNILSLSSFVDRRTFDVIAYPAAEKLDILIKINRSIAEGLAA